MTVGHTESNDKSTCKSSIHNAFQFLQLLLLQKLCSNEYSFNTLTTRYSYHQQHKCSRKYNKNCSYQVFLGGSCNPTTWRHDQAIPYFQSRSVSYFNPQVNNWTEDLVEIEHNAKELAPLLFFVIDHDTRALASIIEVSYLAAKGRNLIVVMNDINRQNAKFLKSYNDENEQQQPHIDNDYDNVYRARKALKFLLKSINIPIFDSVNVALECAAFILDSTSRIVDENNNDSETYTEQPSSNSCLPDTDANRTQSVVVIRSLSNKIMYNSNDEFYNEIKKQIECEKNSSSQDFHRRNSSAEISQSLSQSLSKLSPMKSCPIVPSHSKSIQHTKTC
ncbi:unnamed protein product [Didymodactylos carnosus]|uniref:Uncharacterized protein n=1 Tax=Didymodactylos carnosus TaxID=1234261 RepID=A0A815Q5A0_9BILA|nr:unnamed protein product [Didymodactylos carnosus]CAF4329855.1 unnamed protein product [Didymodactylos carnosus]